MKKSTPVENMFNGWMLARLGVKSVAVLGLALTLFSGCKKDSDEAPAPATPTKTQMLTDKAWKLTASTVSPALMGMTDLFAVMPTCELDNTLKFNSDASKTLVQDEGASKCNSMDPQQVTGSWQLNSDETEVVVNLNSQADTYSLLSISQTGLRVSFATVISGGMYTVTNTYTNQ